MYKIGDIYDHVNGTFVQKPEYKEDVAKIHQAVYQKKANGIMARVKREQKAKAMAEITRKAQQNIAEGKVVACMV